MPSWLTEDPSPVYILLAVAAVALAVAYWNNRKRQWLLGLGGVLLLAVAVWLVDFLVVTERVRLIKTLATMGRAVGALDIDGVFKHLTDDFEFNGMRKASFQDSVRKGMRVYEVRGMQIWGEEVVEVSSETRTAKVEFNAKVRGNWSGGSEFYLVRADWVLEPDGEWRMRRFTLHKPFAATRDPVTIPLPR